MSDTLTPIPKQDVIKLMRIAVGLHIQSLPQLKGRGASKSRPQIEAAVDRFAERVAYTFLSGKIVMQSAFTPARDEGARSVGGLIRRPGEVIYKLSAMLAVQHECGFAIVELLQDVDLVEVGDGVEGSWTGGGLAPLYHQGRAFDAFYHEVCLSREDAIRSAMA